MRKNSFIYETRNAKTIEKKETYPQTILSGNWKGRASRTEIMFWNYENKTSESKQKAALGTLWNMLSFLFVIKLFRVQFGISTSEFFKD